jgi:hypothetical protein
MGDFLPECLRGLHLVMKITFAQILGTLRGVGVGVDQARQHHTVAQIDDLGFWPNEGFNVWIVAHEDNGIAADRERLGYAVVRVFGVNPAVNQDDIGYGEVRE